VWIHSECHHLLQTGKLISVLDICQVAHLNPPKLGGIRKACKDVEFVFLEPSIVVQKVDMPWASSMDDFDSVATTEEEQQTPETTPRAWWLSSGDRQTYRRESLAMRPMTVRHAATFVSMR
jgi:hypothetical protein